MDFWTLLSHPWVMWKRRFFFASLYFVQGTVLAYILNFQKPFLAAQGVSKETLGLFTSLLLIPFILKVFLGMLSDRVPIGEGFRKPYMVIGLAGFGLCYGILSFVDARSSFALFASVTWLASLFLALFDTCSDGWAVDVAEEREQSAIQASMIAGKSAGFMAMSVLFGVIADGYGFAWVFRIIAFAAVLILIEVLRTPSEKVRPENLLHGIEWWDLLHSRYLWFAAFGIFYSIASFGTDGLYTLYLSEYRLTGNTELGFYGVGRGWGSLLGAAAFAIGFRWWSLRKMQTASLFLLGAGCLTPLLQMPLSLSGLVWGFCWGFQETAFVTLAMAFARGRWAATFFAISMIFSNLGTSLGEAFGAPSVPRLGYPSVFAAFAVLAWACLAFVPLMIKPAQRA